tara:strand:- start:74 stop:334 length:261 start_codon:yes stop_codon:yes gene_type:complete
MNNITEEELSMLEACQSYQDWSVACKKIKDARGQMYPDDWWAKVKESGMMERIHNRWGASSEIQMQSFDSKEDLFNHFTKRFNGET